MSRIAGVAAACSTAALITGTSGCGWMNDKHVENDATISQPVRAVHIDNGAGQITVRRGDPGGGIVVRRDIDYHTDQPPTPGQTVADGTLNLTSNCDCGIAYDVTVPESVAVTIVDNAGEVTLDGLAGPIDVTDSAGRVQGQDLRAPRVKVDASAGSIDLAFAAAPTDVSAHSNSGAVTVSVPGGPYAVDATADAGNRSVEVPTDPAAARHVTAGSHAGAVTVQGA